tara:strand:+ start:5155 stop:5556 length:402 start_codon:yes stop_codon:yes gene_type:complete
MKLEELNEFIWQGEGLHILNQYGCDNALRGIFDPYCAEYGSVDGFDRIRILMAFRDKGFPLFEILEAYEELVLTRLHGGRGRPDIAMALGEGIERIATWAGANAEARDIAEEARALIPLIGDKAQLEHYGRNR